MSFQSINPHKPSPSLTNAKTVTKTVKNRVGRLQQLEGKKGVDADPSPDIVRVSADKPNALPQSWGNKAIRLTFGSLLSPVKKEAEEPVTGYAKSEKDKLVSAEVDTHTEGKRASFQYQKLEDGSELFHGPTKDGFAVVHQDNKNGTLAILESEQPMHKSFAAAVQGDIELPEAPETEGNQPTFAETLKSLASGETAVGLGTIAGEVSKQANAVLDKGMEAVEKGKEAIQDSGVVQAFQNLGQDKPSAEAPAASAPAQNAPASDSVDSPSPEVEATKETATPETPEAGVEKTDTKSAKELAQAAAKDAKKFAQETAKDAKDAGKKVAGYYADWAQESASGDVTTLLFGKLGKKLFGGGKSQKG